MKPIMATLQEATQAIAGHIQKPYTEQEIAELIKSGCYDAELMLQHLLRLYNGTSAALERWESEIGQVMPADCKDYWQNDPAERPMVTRLLIESIRECERMAWEQTHYGCQGECSRHKRCKGQIKRIISKAKVPGAVREWGPYYYCEQAIEDDTRNGYEVKEVGV